MSDIMENFFSFLYILIKNDKILDFY